MTKLNLVKDQEKIKKRGDACVVLGNHSKTGEKILQLIICCIRCGEVSGSAKNHIYNKDTKSYHPSIVHDTNLGGCGWHGWLKNGVFTEC